MIPYKHQYEIGGVGTSRKKYYNQLQSSLISLNLFIGREKEVPSNYFNGSFSPPHFKNTIWGINPLVEYDGKGVGLGLGVSLGILGFEDKKSKDLQGFNDYDPKFLKRTSVLQTRVRLFNERYFFLEMLGGYDAGSLGDNYWQILVGSRFNTIDKYLFKAGVIGISGTEKSFVLHGQLPLFSNFYLTPGVILYGVNDNKKSGYRAVVGLEYRLHDRVQD